MDSIHPASAKRASEEIDRLPFGIPTLDGRFRGIPVGSAVLLAGAPDAGTDAFAYTHAAHLMLEKHYPGTTRSTFDGDRLAAIPESVTVVTLEHDRTHLLHQLDSVLSAGQFNALSEHLSVLDLSSELFDVAPVPDDLRRSVGEDRDAASDAPEGAVASFEDFFETLAAGIDGMDSDTMLVLDSLTALERATEFGLEWGRVLGFLSGLRAAASEWDGIVDVLYHARPTHVRSNHTLNTALDGCLYFYANDEGTSAAKTMRVGEFSGALSRRHQVVYKTMVGEEGFSVSTSRRL